MHPADQTTRPQILEKSLNPEYHKLIQDFGNSTGVYCLCKSISLNIHGYPMVCSPEDALFTLKNSSLDGLIIEDNLILRN